ncbi:hypermethylated in cancer 2 protein-like [Protopterus annectens]|uniref:hypermethylated in cancer 2 protein-like n=1 Tax=Protopterus annectens TaxID=7888 RepID=UPI001CFC1805|nr:hypermethylated in cancer 2 protein-like [Protopterus annectens]XP_043940032.1 hypermethylated in cancer 2 protein-like [Protopterus annectens]
MNAHAMQLLHQLNRQRRQGHLCDVVFMVQNSLFRAHKNVMAASSSYMQSLVSENNLVNLGTVGMTPSVFGQILDYIYTGNLPATLDENNVRSILAAANCLMLRDLACLCRKTLTADSCTLRGDTTPTDPLTQNMAQNRPPVNQASLRMNNMSFNLCCRSLKEEENESLSSSPSCHLTDVLSDSSDGHSCRPLLVSGQYCDTRCNLNQAMISIVPSFSALPSTVQAATEGSLLSCQLLGQKAEELQHRRPVLSSCPFGASAGGGVIRCPARSKDIHSDSSCDHFESAKLEDANTIQTVHPKMHYVMNEAETQHSRSCLTPDPFKDELYLCIHCGQDFLSAELLRDHMDGHSKKCDLEQEANLPESTHPPVTQEIPSTESIRSTQLQTSQGKHTNNIPRFHVCDICGKEFTQRGTLNRHMRSHMGVKPYTCSQCGMKFTRQYRVAEHMKVHSHMKSFQCPTCRQSFLQPLDLKDHLRKHS